MNPYRQRLIALAIAAISGDHDQTTELANDAMDLITNETASPPLDIMPSFSARQANNSEPTSWLDATPYQLLPTPIGDLPHWTCPVCNEPRPRPSFLFRNAIRTKCVECYRDSRRRSMASHSRPQISLPGFSTGIHP